MYIACSVILVYLAVNYEIVIFLKSRKPSTTSTGLQLECDAFS